MSAEGVELNEEEIAEADGGPIADIGDGGIEWEGFERVEDIAPDTAGAETVTLPQMEVAEDQASEWMTGLAVEGGAQAGQGAGFVTVFQVEHGFEVIGVGHEGIEAEGGSEFFAGAIRLAEVGIDATAQDVGAGILAFIEDEAGEEMLGIGVTLEADRFDGANVESITDEDFLGGRTGTRIQGVVDGAGGFQGRGGLLIDDRAGKKMRNPLGTVGAEGFRLPQDQPTAGGEGIEENLLSAAGGLLAEVKEHIGTDNNIDLAQGRAGEKVAPAKAYGVAQTGHDLPAIFDRTEVSLLEVGGGVPEGPGAVDAALGEFEGSAIDIGSEQLEAGKCFLEGDRQGVGFFAGSATGVPEDRFGGAGEDIGQDSRSEDIKVDTAAEEIGFADQESADEALPSFTGFRGTL